MNPEVIGALRELEREKGIAFETILQGLEEAMASAYKTWWKQENPTGDDEFVGFRAKIDPDSGDLRMWQQTLDEVEGDEGELHMEVTDEKEVEVTDDFKGRIGAQAAKQVIFQKLGDGEREMTYEEVARPEGVARAHGGERAARGEDRRRALVAQPGGVRRERAPAGQGEGGPDRPRDADRAGRRARLPAVVGDRQGGSERAARSPSDRMADRHQVRHAGPGR